MESIFERVLPATPTYCPLRGRRSLMQRLDNKLRCHDKSLWHLQLRHSNVCVELRNGSENLSTNRDMSALRLRKKYGWIVCTGRCSHPV